MFNPQLLLQKALRLGESVSISLHGIWAVHFINSVSLLHLPLKIGTLSGTQEAHTLRDGLLPVLQGPAVADPLRVAAVSTVVLQDGVGTVTASAALSTAVPPDQAPPSPPAHADTSAQLAGPVAAEADPPQASGGFLHRILTESWMWCDGSCHGRFRLQTGPWAWMFWAVGFLACSFLPSNLFLCFWLCL